jgi:hypothetical protein
MPEKLEKTEKPPEKEEESSKKMTIEEKIGFKIRNMI